MSVHVVHPRSRNLHPAVLATAGLLAVGVWTLGPHEAWCAPQTCGQLMEHPAIIEAAAIHEGSAFRVVDLSSRAWDRRDPEGERQAIADRFVDYGRASQTLRVLAMDLPKGAPLVEVTCAIGRRLRLDVSETLIVITAFGMHAYSGSLTYHQLRALARRHNPHVASAPLGAASRYAHDILEQIQHQRDRRLHLMVISIISFLLGGVAIGALLRRPRARVGHP